MGWYMVKSGLGDQPMISHLRLASHFGLAILIFAYTLWLFLSIKFSSYTFKIQKLQIVFMSWVGLVFLQMLYGSLTAGLRAGLIFNTFPTMNGQWIPNNFVFFRNSI